MYTGMPMDTVDITPNGCYKEITVEPSLGSGFEMNLFLPQINTEVNGFVKTVYTITAKGDAGEASATLTVHFKDCGEDGQSNGLKLVKSTTSYGSEESYELYNSAGELVLQRSGFSNYATYTNSLCLPSGDYTVTLRDTYGDGWSSGAYLKVYDMEDTLLQEFTISNPGNVYTGYFTLTAGSSASMVWKILLDGRSGSGWNNVDFDDSKWASTVVGQLEYGEWQQNTIYARYKFSLTDSIRYPIVQFSLWYKDGVIVYLNGNEVYRRNMKSGSVSSSTTANAMYEGYYTRIGSAPGYLLQDGDNVIAVEIHKHQSTSGQVQFRGAVNPLQGNCISRVDGGSITESSFFNQAYESAAQAWDRNPSTTWIENGIPAWTVYAYNFDRMEWVNKIALTSNSRTQDRDPTSWALYGSTDGVTWEQLLRVEKHVMFESRLQAKEWMMMDHMNSYSQYKFEMYGTFSGNNRVAIADVDIQSCQLNYCVKDGVFPGVMSDETSVAPCPEGFIGEQYRHCSLQELNPTRCGLQNPDDPRRDPGSLDPGRHRRCCCHFEPGGYVAAGVVEGEERGGRVRWRERDERVLDPLHASSGVCCQHNDGGEKQSGFDPDQLADPAARQDLHDRVLHEPHSPGEKDDWRCLRCFDYHSGPAGPGDHRDCLLLHLGPYQVEEDEAGSQAASFCCRKGERSAPLWKGESYLSFAVNA